MRVCTRMVSLCVFCGLCVDRRRRRTPAAAQETARFALDSVLSVDAFGGENVSNRPQIIIDVSAGVRLSDHVQVHIRPWFRLPRPNAPGAPVPDWSKELYQAGIRYERPGNQGGLATRVDFGYNVSPIGLGIIDTRPSLNPTIAPHISYLSAMPAFDLSVPRVSAISQTYPLGAQVAVSSAHWDARTAVINAAPTRNYAVGRPTNPRQAPAYVAGAGVTPFTGLRLGISLAHGQYATADEVDRIGPIESVGYDRRRRRRICVRLHQDERRDRAQPLRAISSARRSRTNGSCRGCRPLTPRWFVAARHESTLAPRAHHRRRWSASAVASR